MVKLQYSFYTFACLAIFNLCCHLLTFFFKIKLFQIILRDFLTFLKSGQGPRGLLNLGQYHLDRQSLENWMLAV